MKKHFIAILIFVSAVLLAGCVTTSPLTKAAEDGDVNKIKVLLNQGTSVDEPSYGFTPLQYAVSYGRIDAVKLLLDRGANVNYYSDAPPSTPLVMAVTRKNESMVKLLLKRGADKNQALDIMRKVSTVYDKEDVEYLQRIQE